MPTGGRPPGGAAPGRQATSLVVFDLDGTLIDSRRDLADATNSMLAEYGGPPLAVDLVAAMVGEGAAVLVRRALATAGLDVDEREAIARFLVHYHARLTAHTVPYAGIPEALSALWSRGVHLAVLTNKPQRATAAILDALDLSPAISDVLGGDTDLGRKPDPAGLQYLIERARATPASTVLVGDSPVDLETARRARTRVCLARYGFGFRFTGREFDGSELFVDEPSELVDVLR